MPDLRRVEGPGWFCETSQGPTCVFDRKYYGKEKAPEPLRGLLDTHIHRKARAATRQRRQRSAHHISQNGKH